MHVPFCTCKHGGYISFKCKNNLLLCKFEIDTNPVAQTSQETHTLTQSQTFENTHTEMDIDRLTSDAVAGPCEAMMT